MAMIAAQLPNPWDGLEGGLFERPARPLAAQDPASWHGSEGGLFEPLSPLPPMPRARHAARGRRAALPAPRQGGDRLGWVDTARGLTMIMVVLLHADVVATAIGQQSVPITLLDFALYPLRMPMFFLVSGMLAAGLLQRSAEEVLHRRVLHYAWLYALWSLIYAGLQAGLMAGLGPPAMRAYYNNIEGPVAALLVTWNNTWFLYALMLFFGIALVLRRLPPAAQMAAALLLALPGTLAWGTAIGLPVLDRFYHLPYFVFGILASARLKEAAPRLGRPALLVPIVLVWGGLTLFAQHERVLREPPVIAALSLLAVPAGLGLAALLAARLPWLARPLQVIGRNTLAIYVLHTLLLRPMMALLPWQALPGAVALPLLALTAVGLALVLGKGLARVPGLLAVPRLGRKTEPALAGTR
ncbi:MAG TPA: acyltransferase family protein [Crenalkalicoccus sp.]|jgi:uncharacterized membrane protein YcfT|nr:acyltransferase family protein [Crenalkalicoccus sp.]